MKGWTVDSNHVFTVAVSTHPQSRSSTLAQPAMNGKRFTPTSSHVSTARQKSYSVFHTPLPSTCGLSVASLSSFSSVYRFSLAPASIISYRGSPRCSEIHQHIFSRSASRSTSSSTSTTTRRDGSGGVSRRWTSTRPSIRRPNNRVNSTSKLPSFRTLSRRILCRRKSPSRRMWTRVSAGCIRRPRYR